MRHKQSLITLIFLGGGFYFGILLGYSSMSRQGSVPLSVPNAQFADVMVVIERKNLDERETVDLQDNMLNLSQLASVSYQDTMSVDDIYSGLKMVLSGLKFGEQVQLPFDVEFIVECEDCIQLLREHLLSGYLSGEQLEQLVDWLSQRGDPELADVLLDAAARMIAQDGYTEHSGIIVSSLENFTSTEVANKYSDYYLNNQNVPGELRESLLRVINNATDRDQIGSYIAEKFATAIDPSMRDKLLEINHPESLEKIGDLALGLGDVELYSKVVEQIKTNPSPHTFDVLLSMYQTQSLGYFGNAVPVEEIAMQWAHHQLSGSRLDFIEKQLAQGSFSEQDKQLVLAILKYSEDQVRGREIIVKFWESG